MPVTVDIRIGLLFSLTGTTSVTERGEYEAALLAIHQINEQGGLYGFKLVPVAADAASDPVLSAINAEKLIVEDEVIAIIGLYTSACRRAILPVLERYNRLLFYPALYEGEELSQYVIYCGPVPNQQLQHFVPWLLQRMGPSVYLIGSDYVYPRESNKHIRRLVDQHGGRVVGEYYAPLGTQRFNAALRDVTQLKPDVVFSNLVGDSVVAFYQQFWYARLNMPIASAITGETEIQAMGVKYAKGHYTSFPYFTTVETPKNYQFRKNFAERYGIAAISFVMESAYYSVWLLARAIEAANSTETNAIRKSLNGIEFEAPQGKIRVDKQNQHLWLHSRIGQVNENGEFDIVWEAEKLIPPLPFYNDEDRTSQETTFDDVGSPVEVLQRVQSEYDSLIRALRQFTAYLPYHFVVLNPDGLTLSVFGPESTNLAPLPPFFRQGVRATSRLLGRCGITMGLAAQSEAIVWGGDHEREELQEWISIGIPIQSESSPFQGVLGVLIGDWPFSVDTISVLCTALKQIVQSALYVVQESKRQDTLKNLLNQTVELLSEGYMALSNGELLVMNSLAESILDENSSLLRFIHQHVQTHSHSEVHFQPAATHNLIEVRIHEKDSVSHVFLKRVQAAENIEGQINSKTLIPGIQTKDNKSGHASSLAQQEEQKTRFETESFKKAMKELVGSSTAFRKNLRMAELAAKTDANVLILGESGTGKELFARAIHNHSKRKNKPFIAINCAAIPRELLSAELFGYVEGAFTGAKRGGSPGKFEAAHEGTLFLDEIGDMPIEQQAVLLRVLQEREVVRVGGNSAIPVDVRIIAATNRRLAQEIAYKGSFRSDLFFRLNVFSLELAPLRNRKDDIPDLVNFFVEEFSAQFADNLPRKSVANDSLSVLLNYAWPGNVRELRNVIEHAFYVSGDSKTISMHHLPEWLYTGTTESGWTWAGESIPSEDVDTIRLHSWKEDRAEVQRVLLQFKGNISRCARELGMSRSTLYRKLREYHLL